jgi:hypothetical protein
MPSGRRDGQSDLLDPLRLPQGLFGVRKRLMKFADLVPVHQHRWRRLIPADELDAVALETDGVEFAPLLLINRSAGRLSVTPKTRAKLCCMETICLCAERFFSSPSVSSIRGLVLLRQVLREPFQELWQLPTLGIVREKVGQVRFFFAHQSHDLRKWERRTAGAFSRMSVVEEIHAVQDVAHIVENSRRHLRHARLREASTSRTFNSLEFLLRALAPRSLLHGAFVKKDLSGGIASHLGIFTNMNLASIQPAPDRS